MTERLKLVTDFGELRAGDLVVIKGCLDCERDERGILTSLETCDSNEYPEDNGIKAWRMLPPCPFDELPGNEDTLLGPQTVADGNVFLVDTGLESSSSQKATIRKPKTVRA